MVTSAGDRRAGRQASGCRSELLWRRLLGGLEEQLCFLGRAVELEDHRSAADFEAPNGEVAVAHSDSRLFISLQGPVIDQGQAPPAAAGNASESQLGRHFCGDRSLPAEGQRRL